MKNKKIIISILILLIGIGGLIYVFIKYLNHKEEVKPTNPENPTEPVNPTANKGENYNSKLIKEVNKQSNNSNYLISPYSIEIALNLLKESTNNNTRTEIEKVVPNRTIKIFNNEKVKVSNGAFIKNKYKDLVLKTFTNNMKTKYDAEIIYDDFKNADPINNWVNEKTDKMIPKLVDNIDPNFMFGVINAVALDLEFQNEFDCSATYKTRFTKEDGLHMDVYMMTNSYEGGNVSYIKKDDYEAISIPYKKVGDDNYEFIGIKVDDISKFINSLDDEKLNNIMKDSIKADSKNQINVKLPKFKYNYDLLTPKFKEVLMNLGIKEVFGKNPDFTGFISQENMTKYGIEPELSEAIHKTYIDLNEKGTKAAAVTAFLVNDKSAIELPDEKKIYNITFDKPFIYMIREKNSGEILFFGTTYEPTKWEGHTCQMTY